MENVAKLAEALSKAQAAITHAPKDSKNPHFKSMYADLASVWGAIRKPLTDNGLSVTQGLNTNAASTLGIFLDTTLMHSSGESVSSQYPIILAPEKLSNPQNLGAAVTYARRYALAAIVGIAQDDDDGNSVSLPQNKVGDVVDKGDGPWTVAAVREQVSGETLATYKVPFGKHKGLTLEEIGPIDVESYCNYIVNTAKAEGKPIRGNVQQFLDIAESYLDGVLPPSKD